MELKGLGSKPLTGGPAPVSKQNESPAPTESTKAPEATTADSPVVDNVVIFTCAPLERLKIGRFQFEKSQLKLEAEEATEFETLLAKVDARTQSKVKKIDVDAAERWLKALRPVATKAIDSSADGVSEKRLVGTEDILKNQGADHGQNNQ